MIYQGTIEIKTDIAGLTGSEVRLIEADSQEQAMDILNHYAAAEYPGNAVSASVNETLTIQELTKVCGIIVNGLKNSVPFKEIPFETFEANTVTWSHDGNSGTLVKGQSLFPYPGMMINAQNT